MKKSHKILLAILAFFVLIQLIPVDRTNPEVTAQIKWDSETTKATFTKACADCHSNETKWPFYAYVAPVSWLVAYDVNEGREKFNISNNNLDEASEAAEEVEKGAMPIKPYLITHSDADLSADEKSAFVAGLVATFGRKSEKGEGH